jgi:hypothetical protein
MSVKLNKAEQEIVDLLPESMRAEATAKLLAPKAESMERVSAARNTFSTRISDDKLIVYGLGNRFPVTLRKKGWQAVIANIEAIKAEVSKLK